MLYYYLLPEQPRPSPSQRSPSAYSSAYSLSPAPSSIASSSPEPSPRLLPTARVRSQTPPPMSALAQATEGFVPETPRKRDQPTPRARAPGTPSSNSAARPSTSADPATPRRRVLLSESSASATSSPRRARPVSFDGGASSSTIRRAEEALREVGRVPPLTPRRAHLHRRGESVDAIGLRRSGSTSSSAASSDREGSASGAGSRVRGVVSDLEERIRKSLQADQQPAFSLDPPPSPRKAASAQRLAHSSDPVHGSRFSSSAQHRRAPLAPSQSTPRASHPTVEGDMGPPPFPGPRSGQHRRSPSLLESSSAEEAESGDREDGTPRARRRRSAAIPAEEGSTPRARRPGGVPVVEVREATPTQKRASSPPGKDSETRRRSAVSPSLAPGRSPSLSASEAEDGGPSRADGTRTEEEKRNLLRHVSRAAKRRLQSQLFSVLTFAGYLQLMPNIDALQARFENLGWRDGLA